MTSANISIVRIEGTEAHVRMFLRDVNGRATKIVRDKGNVVYVCLPSQELGWLDKVARDVNVKKQEVRELPAHQVALCGICTTQLKQHSARCKRCTAMRPKKSQDGECKTVTKAIGLQDASLSGLICLM